MKYLLITTLLFCAFIISRKPKEPTDPNATKGKNKVETTSTRS